MRPAGKGPLDSLYFNYPHFPARRVPELDGVAARHPVAIVGAGERPEFIRQNALLANIWTGLGAQTCTVEEPGRHHFNVIDGLADPHHAIVQTLLSLPPG